MLFIPSLDLGILFYPSLPSTNNLVKFSNSIEWNATYDDSFIPQTWNFNSKLITINAYRFNSTFKIQKCSYCESIVKTTFKIQIRRF